MAVSGAMKSGFSFLYYVRKHWYIWILLILLLPSIIGSIRIAVQTENPTYPLFDLASRILSADASLDDTVDSLRANPDFVIGMEKPTTGIWRHLVYGWSWFWNVPYRILGDVWLIFFPLVLIYKLIYWIGDQSTPAKNWFKATWIFLVYLFITNTIILIYRFTQGTISLDLSGASSEFYAYFLIFMKVLPFHGIINLVMYIVQVALGTA